MIAEHDRVVLTSDIPAESLKSGDVGAVVHSYADGKAYEVEFVSLEGRTLAVVTVEASQLRSTTANEITHAREISAA